MLKGQVEHCAQTLVEALALLHEPGVVRDKLLRRLLQISQARYAHYCHGDTVRLPTYDLHHTEQIPPTLTYSLWEFTKCPKEKRINAIDGLIMGQQPY